MGRSDDDVPTFPSLFCIQTRVSRLVFLRESGGADEMLFNDGKRLELLNAIVHTRVGTTTRRNIYCIGDELANSIFFFFSPFSYHVMITGEER